MKKKNSKTYSTSEPVENTSWLQRLGVAGFTFFLAKGLLWIVAIAWAVQ